MTDQNILDKSMRSVFVGNIPYEATEEKLKDIFNEVGPVISFKLVYDRETGKPKGYGFCEYKDQETALSAMRNLNGYEIGGRTLRVDNACTEKSRLEMQSLMMAMPTSESHYGDAVNADKAPEIINGVIASLPPEQMFELLRQMKDCIQNNPVEARNMLLQNPQLGYALLQTTVVMKIVNPEVALAMLHSAHKVPPTPNMSSTASALKTQPTPQIQNNNVKWATPNPPLIQPRPDNIEWNHHINNVNSMSQNVSQVSFDKPPPSLPVESSQSLPGLRDYPKTSIMDSDIRSFRDIHNHMPNINSFMTMPPLSIPPPVVIRPSITSESQFAPRGITSNQPHAPQLPSKQPATSDSEKAALIMQVLQLTDAQISMLPSEQRNSIMQLKEKITLSSQKKD